MTETSTLLEKSLQYLIDEALREREDKSPKNLANNAVEVHNAAYQAVNAARRKTPFIEEKNAIGKKPSKKKKLKIDRDFKEENWTMAKTSLTKRDLFKL